MKSILNGILPVGYDYAPDFRQLGNTPFAENAISLVHAPAGAGKSYALVNILGNDKDVSNIVYCDADVNSSSFRNYCLSNGVEYAGMSNFWNELTEGAKLHKLLLSLPEGTVAIVDSYASVFPGVKATEATSAAKPMYDLAKIASKKSISLIVIDHSTKQWGKDKDGKNIMTGFKVEGSESGKFKATASACRYQPADWNDPTKGGTLVVERSRIDNVRVSEHFLIGLSKTLNDAKAFIASKFTAGETITKAIFTTKTKHSRDHWVREFQDQLFKTVKVERTVTLIPLNPIAIPIQTSEPIVKTSSRASKTPSTKQKIVSMGLQGQMIKAGLKPSTPEDEVERMFDLVTSKPSTLSAMRNELAQGEK